MESAEHCSYGIFLIDDDPLLVRLFRHIDEFTPQRFATSGQTARAHIAAKESERV